MSFLLPTPDFFNIVFQDSPIDESGKKGPIVSIPEISGLHHRYQQAA
jgi:hypothetical protein